MPAFSVTTEGEEALTTSLETVLQLRGSTAVIAKIWAWGVGFDGTSSSAEPVRVRLLRQTTDGTATAATEVQITDPEGPAANCASFHTFTAEPTPGDVIWEGHIHPQGGRIDFMYPPGREVGLADAATSRVAIDVLAPAAVNVTGYIHWDE